MSELTRQVYDMGVEDGREEGMEKGIARTARAMLRDNMDVLLVSRYTSLPVEEIERLKASETA